MSLPSSGLRSGEFYVPLPLFLTSVCPMGGPEMKEREEGFLTNHAPQNSASKYRCSEYFIPGGSRDKMKAMSSTQTLPNLKGSTYEFPIMGWCKSYMCSVGIVFLILNFCVYLFFIAIRGQFLQPSNID